MSYERRVLLRHSLASIVALGITGLSRFLYSVIIARRFGVDVLGTANSLISKAFFVAIPLSFFAVALGKYSSEFLGRDDIDAVRSITLPAFLMPVIGLLLLPLNMYLSLLAVFRAVQLTFRSFLYGIHRGEHYAYVIVVSFIGFALGFLVPDVFAPYLVFLGVIAFVSAVYLWVAGFVVRPRWEYLRLMVTYSSFAFLGTLSGVFLVQGPYFMSERLLGSEAAGEVSAVLSAVFLLTYIPQVLQSAIMPMFSYKHGRAESGYVKNLAEKVTEFIVLITGSLVFILMIFGREILSAVFGFEIGPSFYLALMAIEIYVAYNPSIVALNSTAYVKRGTLVSLLGAGVALVSWLLLVPVMGSVGVMGGLLLAYATILAGVVYYSKSLLGISPHVYLPLIAALILQASVFVSKYLLLMAFGVFLFLELPVVRSLLELVRGVS
ncbi:hypothetical protein APY94_03020 [Thermococcus celericrescens]|uniref:Lipopolysaccharide biosynthesis protein n=1 Tax=Thermococcus celericrescens TaxID=227598 RepID=A0A100XZ40_9EURY|nr:hypothetical protein [Thermococcus celericrescens]KUH34261.1 hypothetical protein APY94_03020 [Thermococcus celericrescens]